jgi:hypothetical protein
MIGNVRVRTVNAHLRSVSSRSTPGRAV